MGITFTIVGGIIVVTLITVVFDYIGKKKGKGDMELEGRVVVLEERLRNLDTRLLEKDERIERLENDIRFMNKLIEKKPE